MSATLSAETHTFNGFTYRMIKRTLARPTRDIYTVVQADTGNVIATGYGLLMSIDSARRDAERRSRHRIFPTEDRTRYAVVAHATLTASGRNEIVATFQFKYQAQTWLRQTYGPPSKWRSMFGIVAAEPLRESMRAQQDVGEDTG